jgi:hypothetical protein
MEHLCNDKTLNHLRSLNSFNRQHQQKDAAKKIKSILINENDVVDSLEIIVVTKIEIAK